MLKGYNFLGQSINTGICLSIAVLDFPKRQPVQRVPVVINNRCIVSFNVVSPTYKSSVTLNPFLLMVSYQTTTSILEQIHLNLAWASLGNSHLTRMSILGLPVPWLETKQENLDARNSTSLIKEGFIRKFWKLHLFFWSHKFQVLNTKKEFLRKGLIGMRVSLQEFSFNLAETKGSQKENSILYYHFFL